MKVFKTNQNKPEGILRFLLGILLVPAPFVFAESAYSSALFVVGGVLLFNALVGTCYIYRVFSINTCKA
ncbi:MAG: DUF2892 domain-containing protein [Candidatus Neomarinimicrobiota bacterium]|nr:DUF2892 domain-containing protein [Candidatus Neomarinimicrobiota bacterium]